MFECQHKPLPAHVEAMYSRYWRDDAGKWRDKESTIRCNVRLMHFAVRMCRDRGDTPRQAHAEARAAILDRHVARLDEDIPWAERKAILELESSMPCTHDKYFPEGWAMMPDRTEPVRIRPAVKTDEASGSLWPAIITAALVALLIYLI